MASRVDLDEVLAFATRLSAVDKVRLIESLAPQIKQELVHATQRKSLLGLCADLGPAPSAEEIDAARREAWGNFPRGDIQ